MTENEEQTQTTQAEEGKAAPPETEAEAAEETPPAEPPLTEILVDRFEQALESDGDKAYKRWGFALFHSIDDQKAEAQVSRLRGKPRDALDHYNAGCTSAEKRRFADAVRAFATALELDPEFPEAQFNYALAQEKTGDLTAARKSWNKYLDQCENSEEESEIKNHLTELANK